jgi:hypothetical protein
MANGFEHPAYHWYLDRVETGWNDPVALVYDGDSAPHAMPNDVPLSEIYEDIGWAMMRNCWQDDATLLAVKSGFTWNHAHPDAGSFLLFHGGQPLIIDSGRCSYSRPQYTNYYRTSRAHNVVLTDGEAQNPEDCARGDRGVVHPGRVRYLMDASGMKYVMADATGPTSWKFSRNYRHFLWIDDVILIVDDVRTHEPGQLEWLLHYAGEAEEEGAHVRLSNSAASTAVVWPLYPRDMTLTRKMGLQDNDPDRETEYLSWSPAEKCREMEFITAVMPLQDAQQGPRVTVELLEEEEMLGVRISAEHEITDVFLNLRADGRRMHRNSNHTFLGWETDAYLFAVTYPREADAGPEAIKRLLVASGSYLRRDGQVVLDSLSKVYALAGSTADSLDVQLAGQPLIRCGLRVGNRPKDVRLNAASVPVAWDEAAGVVRLRVE